MMGMATENEDVSPPSRYGKLLKQARGALRSEYRRIGAFGAVGVVNTALDFGLLNLLHFHFKVALIPANLISTTVAMVFSFFANRRVVFHAHNNKQTLWRQAFWFWVVTAIGLYGIQTSIIWAGTHFMQSPLTHWGELMHSLVPLTALVISTNSLKLVASIASLTWNYVLYKKFVFVARDQDKTSG